MNRHFRKALGFVARPLIATAGRAFVRGRDLEHATSACRTFAAQGVACTLGYFNADGDAPRAVADVYLAALDALAAGELDGYLSVKVPALGFDRALVAEVAARGEADALAIHFDSHALDMADRTWSAIEHASTRCARLGCTLPGRWPRSLDDAERAIAGNLQVRIVKGQWADPAHPEIDLREGFLAVVDRLAGKAKHVAVASHDPPLAREALRRLQAAGTSCELELLVGLPMRASLRMARELGVRVRAYVPCGVAWAAYALAQAQKNPGLMGWVLRDLTLDRLG